jgi:phenylacetate-CoA ligase
VYPEISEAERFPLLTPAGRKLLHAMRQHPTAPIWNWPNGEQLDAAGLARVREFAQSLRVEPRSGSQQLPEWLGEFVEYCLAEVPFYRRRSPPGSSFREIPSCSREDMSPRVWEFVPDSQPLDRLIVFSSSGTTGHATKLPTHPATAACGVPLLETALESVGQRFPRGPDAMALTNITAYRGAYTTAIVVGCLEEAGCIRVNLCDEDWRSPGDCHKYLDRWHAPIMLGDPLAFAELERVAIEKPPQVMVSSVLHLSDAFARELTARYGCPVLDLYALTEAGIVAMRAEKGHVVLPLDIYLEVLNEFDEPCPSGVRGEITLTGGRNPFLPLLRFRTGDFGALEWHDNRAVIVGLEGRPPVLFPTRSGRVVHSMEVSRLLRTFPLIQYRLHQDADGGFRFGYRGSVNVDDLQAALQELLGSPGSLTLEELHHATREQRKVHQYWSDCTTPVRI